MKFSRQQIIKVALMAVFLICMLYANFYAIRRILRFGWELYFYDKLLVAYDIGGAKGLEDELGKIRAGEKSPLELALAKDFEIKLKGLKDPAAFLGEKVAQNKRKIGFIRGLRAAAIIIMFILFGWRLLVNFKGRFGSKIS